VCYHTADSKYNLSCSTKTLLYNSIVSFLADELSKLPKLKEQGVLSEAEITQRKQDLIKKMT
jgi:hypothetical protein